MTSLPFYCSLSLLVTIISIAVSALLTGDEIPFEDLPAFTSAYQSRGCITECAVEPSKTFKKTHNCDPANPAECICADPTASVALRSSMMLYCWEKCDNLGGPLATRILGEYCSVNLPKGTASGSSGPITRATATTSSGGYGSSTALTRTTAYPAPATSSTSGTVGGGPTDGSKAGGERLSKSDRVALAATLAIGIPSVLIAATLLWLKLRRRRGAAAEPAVELEPVQKS